MGLKTGILFALYLLSISLINLILSFQLHNEENTYKWVEHTNEVIIESQDFLSALKAMQTGQIAYLLTHNESSLQAYLNAKTKAEERFLNLRQLTADNLTQQNRLQSLQTEMELSFHHLKTVINLTQEGAYDEALRITKNDEAKLYMNKIDILLKAFIQEEENLLISRTKALKEETDKNILFIRSLSILLLSALFYFIYRTLNQKHDLQLANQKALDASRSKSEFLANMSHEIRTPLNAILGFINLLKKKIKEDTSLEYLNIIDASSKSLLNIIEDILDFSKIESGKLEIDKIDFNIKEEFEVITHLFDARCSEKNITLVLDFDESLPENVNTDPFRIKQVIANLLSNALKFSKEETSIFVSISYHEDALFVCVKDEGVGIALHRQKDIFTAFTQEDSSTTRSYGGTGLGLSISSDLVTLLGGKFTLESTLGQGSTFCFNVPATIAQAPKKQPVYESDFDLEGKILLVEDNKTNQLLMKIILTELNLEYDVANDGLEAIDKFQANTYDAILMDENMPNMGGMEATSHIRIMEQEQDLKRTPIIALTANAVKGDKEKFLNAGMDEYRSKPLDKEILSDVLHKVMSKD